MAPKSLFSVSFICMILLLHSGGTLKLGQAQEKTWCVAEPSSTDAELMANIKYSCDQPAVACNIIQEGGACFHPNTLMNHASVVMNIYYQAFNRTPWTCDFTHSGLTTVTDPSYEKCKYAFGVSTGRL